MVEEKSNIPIIKYQYDQVSPVKDQFSILSPKSNFDFEIRGVKYHSLIHLYYFQKYIESKAFKEKQFDFQDCKFLDYMNKEMKVEVKNSNYYKTWKSQKIQIIEEALPIIFESNKYLENILIKSFPNTLKCVDKLSKFWNSQNESSQSIYDQLLTQYRIKLVNSAQGLSAIQKAKVETSDQNVNFHKNENLTKIEDKNINDSNYKLSNSINEINANSVIAKDNQEEKKIEFSKNLSNSDINEKEKSNQIHVQNALLGNKNESNEDLKKQIDRI